MQQIYGRAPMPEAYSETGKTPKMEYFSKNSNRLLVVNYFRKKLHVKCFFGF